MRFPTFPRILFSLIAASLTNVGFAQPESEQYIWPIDDPNVFTGTQGGTNNLVSGTIGEYRPADVDGDPPEHFHEGADMPYVPGTSVWYQSYLVNPDGTSSYAEVLTVGGSSFEIENKWLGFEGQIGFKYIHISNFNVQDGDRIVDGPAFGIVDRWQDPVTGIWYHPRQLRIAQIQNRSDPHLHFEDRFGGPLAINSEFRGLNPYSDFQLPVINTKQIYTDNPSAPVTSGTGTSSDPYRTNGVINLDVLADLYDPTNNPGSRTIPAYIACDTRRDYDFALMDYNEIEFSHFSNADHGNNGHLTGVNLVYGPGTQLNPTIYRMFVTHNFSHFSGGSNDYIRNLEKGTKYVATITAIDAGLNVWGSDVYFITGPQISGNVSTSTYWTTEVDVIGDVFLQPSFGSITVELTSTGTLTVRNTKNLWVRAGATLIIRLGATVNLEGDGEIIADGGTVIDENGNFSWSQLACVSARNGGLYKNTSANILTVDNGGFLHADGGTIELPNSNVVIKSGSFLQLRPGATVKVKSDRSITVEAGAYVDAVGTAASQITFTSANAAPFRSDWGTVFIYSSNNTFEHCIIEGSDWGLKFVGPASGNVVRNCTFRQNDQAIRIHYNDAEVRDCLIEDNRHAFVLIDNTSQYGGVYLDDNTVRNYDRDGIYSINSVVDVFRCLFDNNGLGDVASYHGIYATSTSDIALGTRSWMPDLSLSGGYNTIKNSHGAGIYLETNALVLVGEYSNATRAGNNSLHDNGSASGIFNGKEVYNTTGTTVLAHQNYWGGTPTASQFYGSVDYNYWLNSPPSGTSIVGLPPGDGSSSSADGIRRSLVFAMSPGTGSSLAKNDGTQLSGADDDDTRIKKEMIRNLRALIAQSPESPEAVAALMTIFSFIRTDWNDKLGERNGIYGYLNGLYQTHGQLEIGKRALHLMSLDRLSRNDFAEAIGLAQTATARFSGPLRQESMSLLIRLLLRTGQMAQAQQLFDAYKTDYPDDVNTHELLQGIFDHAEHDFAHSAPVNGGLPRPALDEALMQTNTPREFSLVQNFPNPFNPTTAIHYALPQAGKVTLRIFNVLGEQVRVLVDEYKPAGKFTEVWGGKNSQGKTVASGIYLYQISYLSSEPSAQTIVRSGKMSLLR